MSFSLKTKAKNQPLAIIGIVLLILFSVGALFAPWLTRHDPYAMNLAERLAGPSVFHWFGTDELGRDVLTRTLYGARISLLVAVSVVSLSGALGLVAGTLSGF